MLEKAIQGARLLYAYTMYFEAPIAAVFRYTGDPAYWARDFDGKPLEGLALTWEGKAYKPGSKMTLSPVREDGTLKSVNSVPMQLLYYKEGQELTFSFLTGSHLIYRFFYEAKSPTRTEFTVNVLVDAESSRMNTIRQRLYGKARRRASIKDHMRVRNELQTRALQRTK
jgi:hypothetical protein